MAVWSLQLLQLVFFSIHICPVSLKSAMFSWIRVLR